MNNKEKQIITQLKILLCDSRKFNTFKTITLFIKSFSTLLIFTRKIDRKTRNQNV